MSLSYTILTSRRRWALWNNLLRINVNLGLWELGRNDPKLGADRPRSWGGSTAFGADVGRIDPGRIDRYPFVAPYSHWLGVFNLLKFDHILKKEKNQAKVWCMVPAARTRQRQVRDCCYPNWPERALLSMLQVLSPATEFDVTRDSQHCGLA